ncbi:MAG TPA: HEAT repeat domain-containing protein [candidate division WOR-3 bacterium]|uniref:HEAT repeat domain-containing protein n=1 Tax=candidate division WOR-3 bacterium TaxID=2052148 RepID=A0A9C9K0G7_UNCW3|nr:HEAT repeat domain-containing protein [candidate division WOR-3 bacterium]
MEQSIVNDFLKEIAVGFRSAKSYPPGHPVMDKVINNTITHLNKLFAEIPEFSMYFLEQTVIFQDQKFDMARNIAVKSLLDTFRKIEVNSLTFESGVSSDDIRNMYEVISSPKLKIKQYGSVADMLVSKGTTKIKINAVKFGIQTGGAVQMTTAKPEAVKSQSEIVEAIKNLKDLVEAGITGLELKTKFSEVARDIASAPAQSRQSYSEAVARILEQLPAEHRIELLRDVELKPFVLKLLSKLKDETLVELIMAKAEQKGDKDFKGIISGMGEEKFARIMPVLKEKIPDVYKYLAQLGLVLSEKMSTTVSKEDLRNSIIPYYNMLDSQNAHVREEGLKSLITIAGRFVKQGNYEMADEIIQRITAAIEQESVAMVLTEVIDQLRELYNLCAANKQKKSCDKLLEPFNKILGRGGLSVQFKKKVIKFLSETGNRIVLPMLFSFLWESGIYPEVRTAIVKFGKDAVSEALLTLKEAEEMFLRTKLVDILKNIGKESIEILIENLDSGEWFLRRNIIAILGEIGDQSIVDRLLPYLEDEDDRVRLELVRTFRRLGYESGLLKALKDVSIEVKTEALKGLRKSVDEEKVKELLSLFKEKGDSLHTELLGLIGHKRVAEAAEPIAEFLKSLESRDDTAAEELKEVGIMTLAKLKTKKVRIILEQLKLSKDRTLKTLAAEALKRIS